MRQAPQAIGNSQSKQQLRLLEVHPQGYGLQRVFSDGHERGIYPWDFLAGMAEGLAADIAGELN
jgi:DUF971 family protein